MQARLDLAAQKGCDGVEPDNVDGDANERRASRSSATDQLTYNTLAGGQQAHARGLSIGLKNDLDEIRSCGRFHWALNEECFSYDECAAAFTVCRSGKAVFG